MILAPLRGVTIRCFRETFADEIRGAGFTEAVTPFISAIPGFDPLQDRELREREPGNWEQGLKVTPQFIGKDPLALRACLEKVKAAGYDTADLNCGCPYPMVRNKGRGSGLLRTPDVLRRMLEVGCDVMGPGKFSIKARLGVDLNGELLGLMPLINEFPLRFLTVHARTARQMYGGIIDDEGLGKVAAVSKVPVVRNGDVEFPLSEKRSGDRFPVMIGRSFVRWLGTREDSGELLSRYIAASQAELCGDRPVLGRMKELIAYWKELPRWRRRWDIIKLCRSVDELKSCLI
jgi:tRNA-dihydrouridine synthase